MSDEAANRDPDAEDASRALENEQLLRTVLLAAHAGIIVQARDGRLLLWNKTAERVLGASA